MTSYAIGLDLGQASDPTALAVLKITDSGQADLAGRPLPRLDCVHLERLQLGTSYPDIVKRVVALCADPRLRVEIHRGRIPAEEFLDNPRLVIDATGVGRSVVDMFIDAAPEAEVLPLTITAGDKHRRDSWNQEAGTTAYWVPKKELVGSVQAGLQSGRLKFAGTLKLADTLKKELLAFRVKVSVVGNESFGAWRERDHDDLVLAVAMASWVASLPSQWGSWGVDPIAYQNYLLARG
jgi:hypothetical protein